MIFLEVDMETATVRVRDVQPSGPQVPANLLSEQQAAWGLQQDAGVSLALELSRHLVSESELRDLLRAAIGSIRRLVSSDAACLFVRGRHTAELETYVFDVSGGAAGLREGAAIPVATTIAGQVFETGELWVGSREQAPATSMGSDPSLLIDGSRMTCMLPIRGRSEVLGTFAIARRQNNAYDPDERKFLTQVSKQIAFPVEHVLLSEENRELKKRLAEESIRREDEVSDPGFEDIIGTSEVLRRALKDVEVVASTDATVLICGETGTGKELIARAIHNLSPRRHNAFVKLNCAAIPTGLLESELFGHERGAFTGAVTQRIGRFEVANHGTIFLDEVGEIPLELQTKLLRVLQEREFERLGSTRTIRTDARLIAATNRDLFEMVQEQEFRSDLFYRLNVFPIRVPALRERVVDIPLLVRHFVKYFAKRMNKVIDTIPSEAMNALIEYSWPGNIRELQNFVERAVILTSGPVLRVPLHDLPKRIAASSTKSEFKTIAETERDLILETLKKTKWVIAGPNGAADRLGMNRSTLRFRMNKLGIIKPWKVGNEL
jgi:formate hydrogenlyase transcriptional activator